MVNMTERGSSTSVVVVVVVVFLMCVFATSHGFEKAPRRAAERRKRSEKRPGEGEVVKWKGARFWGEKMK